jgi:hypothetical protein
MYLSAESSSVNIRNAREIKQKSAFSSYFIIHVANFVRIAYRRRVQLSFRKDIRAEIMVVVPAFSVALAFHSFQSSFYVTRAFRSFWLSGCSCNFGHYSLQKQNAENLKQIFPEKEYRGLSPNFQIHVSVSELCIPTMGLTYLLEEICGPMLGIYKSFTNT